MKGILQDHEGHCFIFNNIRIKKGQIGSGIQRTGKSVATTLLENDKKLGTLQIHEFLEPLGSCFQSNC